MREIDLTINAPKRRVTVMSYGASRAGKTRFAATFPRPLFLSDNSEGGWETIRNMNPEDWYEPDVTPRVWAMEKPEDIVKSIANVEGICRGPLTVNGRHYKPGDIQTVVVDSLTFYSDTFLAHLTRTMKDMRQVYQSLGSHLREVMIRMHELPVNVVWICLEKGPPEDNPTQGAGPLIPGQTKDKAPPRCDYLFYHRSLQRGQDVAFEVHTKRFGVWPAGGRDEGALQDPLPDASYRAMAEGLGLITGTGAYSPAELAEKQAADAAADEAEIANTPPTPAPQPVRAAQVGAPNNRPAPAPQPVAAVAPRRPAPAPTSSTGRQNR